LNKNEKDDKHDPKDVSVNIDEDEFSIIAHTCSLGR